MSVQSQNVLMSEHAAEAPVSMAAVGEMYQAHHSWLYDWMRRKLGSSDRAEDLSHDTFVRLMTARQRDVIKEPRAFLLKVAHDIIVNFWRRQDLEHAYLNAIACLPEATYPSPEDRLAALDALRELDAMLDRLPEKVKRAFLMAHLDNMTYQEISERLHVSERMIKKYMAQAMLNCLLLSSV